MKAEKKEVPEGIMEDKNKTAEKESLEELCRDAVNKRKEIRMQIIQNEDRMQEIDRFRKEALSSDQGDLHAERLKREAGERALLSERNENLFGLMNDLDMQIRQLKELMDLSSKE